MGSRHSRKTPCTQFIDQLIFTGVDSFNDKDETTKVTKPKKKGFFSGFFADDKPVAKKK